MSPRVALIAVLVALCALPGVADAAAGIQVRHERVTYGRDTSMVTVVTMPRPGGNRVLMPALPGGIVSEGAATVSAVSKQLSRHGTAVAINADLFEYATGQPSGLLLIDGIVYNQPQGERPALQIDGRGRLSTSRPRARGTLKLPSRKVLPFEVNVRSDPNGTVFYDRGWGPSTPAGGGRDVLTRLTGGILDDRHETWSGYGTMRVRKSSAGRLPIPPNESTDQLFQASGTAARELARVRAGQDLRFTYRLGPLAPDVASAVGGGPVLIHNGKIVFSVKGSSREFTSGQLVPPDARTAVAQLRDGRILFYAADLGDGSTGLTIAEVAKDLKRRGAVTAMSFDSGGSTSVAINGRLLNKPSDGVERPVGNQLVYFVADRGDGDAVARVTVGKRQAGAQAPSLSFTTVRTARFSVSLHNPRGQVFIVVQRKLPPGVHRIPLPSGMTLRPGRWQAIVTTLGDSTNVAKDFTVVPAATTKPAATPPTPAPPADDGAPATPAQAKPQHDDALPWILLSIGIAVLLVSALSILLVRTVRRR